MDEFRKKITIAQWEGSVKVTALFLITALLVLNSFVKHIKVSKALAKENGQILLIFIMERGSIY